MLYAFTPVPPTYSFNFNDLDSTQVQTNSVALSPPANYTGWATATCRRNIAPTFVDRGVPRGQRGGSPTVVNLSFLGRLLKYKQAKLSL
jgi:hypothetical protein